MYVLCVCSGGGLAGLEDIFGAPALTPNNGGGAPANNNVMGGGLGSTDCFHVSQ